MDSPPKELNVTTHLIAPKSFLSLSSTFFAGDNMNMIPGQMFQGRELLSYTTTHEAPPRGVQEVSAEDAPLLVSYGRFFILSNETFAV
jgi:hypothetical protein